MQTKGSLLESAQNRCAPAPCPLKGPHNRQVRVESDREGKHTSKKEKAKLKLVAGLGSERWIHFDVQ